MSTDTKTLIEAMRILARDIQSEDGVANAAIAEAANRLVELDVQLTELRQRIENAIGEADKRNAYACANTLRDLLKELT